MKKPLTVAITGLVLLTGLTVTVGMGDSGKKLDAISTTQATQDLIAEKESKEREQERIDIYKALKEASIQKPINDASISTNRLSEEKVVKVEIPTMETAVKNNVQSIQIQEMDKQREEVKAEEIAIAKEIKENEEKVEEQPATNVNSASFTATAYDLSVNSCGKSPSHAQYGVTRSGYSLKGMTRAQAMSIAVDPKIIPLGTTVYIEFPSPYEHFNGNYTARDTGSAIKGNIVDIFMGDFNKIPADQSVWDFGKRKVTITY